jgi:SAM-dependent methyltransferase
MLVVETITDPLYLDTRSFRALFEQLGPSLSVWRAAEIAALRTVAYEPPVLDLGCGDGLVTSFILSRVDIGLDPDPRALARAAGRGLYHRMIPTTLEEARLPEEGMATVLSNSVLEHLPDPNGVLAAIAHVLRPGGRLILTVPTSAFSCWLFLPSARYATRRNRQLIHRNLWPAHEWARRLARVGLEVEIVRPYLSRRTVRAWDALDLLERVWIGRQRVVSLVWHRLSPGTLERLARRASRLNLAAPPPGGGQLLVARKQEGRRAGAGSAFGVLPR